VNNMYNNVHHLITYYPKSSGLFNAESRRILDYKHGNADAMAHYNQLILQWISTHINQHHLIMAIPSSKAGNTNTITRTCRALASESPWLIDATDMIRKTKSTASFCRTGKRDAFLLAGTLYVSDQVQGHHVLLLDDVGSTCTSMYVTSHLLLSAGAASVTCLAIARTYLIHT